MLKSLKRKAAALTILMMAGVGLNTMGAPPASAAAHGPGAPGCYSYDTGFGRNSHGYYGWGQVNCNRIFWVTHQVKLTPRGGSARVISERGSGWLSGTRPSPAVMYSDYFSCARGAGYQVVDIIWFKRADGSAYQGGYFTSGAPRALC